ncbi:MAG: nucleotide sugar dehydrogenase [Candidatus Zixiibacteriota bacterium]|nr:MAG: nucleotide sugar dehydrogenase [candidate division Zixibacteria bacterium]
MPESAVTARLAQDIGSKKIQIGVIGLGYVGLPLAVEFARNGFRVIGFDIMVSKVEALNRGENYIADVDSELLADLVKSGLLGATQDFSRLTDTDAISICVPTPLGKTGDPDLSYILNALQEVKKYLRPGHMIVLESTTYPGTTEEVLLPELQESGLKVGQDFFLAFSPERVDPGNPQYQTRNTPKIIGGVTPACTEIIGRLYSSVIERVIPVSSTRAAEMVKLLENTFRSINIGLVNEIAIICNLLNVDVWEVIDAAATKPFGYMPFYPGPGLGGHCIPIDPSYLSWKLRTLDYRTKFIDLAVEINRGMPGYMVSKVVDALNDQQQCVRGARIMILGVSYKRDIDDMRESPAIDIMKHLREKGAELVYHDPYVPHFWEDGGTVYSTELTEKTLAEQDCVVIVTDHSKLDYAWIANHCKLIVDSRNATRGLHGTAARIVKL